MKATIFQDAQRGEGHGIIDIADFPGMSEIPPFVIQRLSDGLYLVRVTTADGQTIHQKINVRQ